MNVFLIVFDVHYPSDALSGLKMKAFTMSF